MAVLSDLVDDIIADIQGLVMFSPTGSRYERFINADLEYPIIVVAPENNVNAATYIELPIKFDDARDRIRFGIEGAIESGIVTEGDAVVCNLGIFEDGLNSLVRVRVGESLRSGIYDLFVNSRADSSVIRDVFNVAIELGKKGQKGKPVGALFVVGDAGKVMNKSRPLSYNPFEKSHVHVGDPIVKVMLKEFSRLDGAFIVSDSGKIVSAYRYLEPGAEGVDIPKGLGARHMAGAAITRETNSTTIVLSESDGLVRAFKGGELIFEVDPEVY
jgi:diadenylate cyclase